MQPDFISYDNPRGGDYRAVPRRLKNIASVKRMALKTTLRLERDPGVKFTQLKSEVRKLVDPYKGSAMLVSRLGNVYELNNRGNQPGVWLRKN